MSTDRLIRPLGGLVMTALLTGCYDEGLSIFDLDGTVVVAREAATRTVVMREPVLDENGNPEINPADGKPIFETVETVVEDPNLIGPVYLGLYAETEPNQYGYRHPVQGPDGKSFPYAGTTLGDFYHPCVQALNCRVLSNRFGDFDEMLDWFDTMYDVPMVDDLMQDITTGQQIRQACIDLLFYTTDDEIRLTQGNQFVENEDGDFEAPFRIWQANFAAGLEAWAFMDAPDEVFGYFDTCWPHGDQQSDPRPTSLTEAQQQGTDLYVTPAGGNYFENTYTRQYSVGGPARDVLSDPWRYMALGDGLNWVVTEAPVWEDPYETVTVVIDDNPIIPDDASVGVVEEEAQ